MIAGLEKSAAGSVDASLQGPLRLRLPLREERESNLAQGAPPPADATPPYLGTGARVAAAVWSPKD